MKFIKFLITGMLFGIVMAKSEAISWYRIQEMFRFQSIHMYGIIGTAVMLGVLGVFIIKRLNMKDIFGNPIVIAPKEKGFWRYIFGGIIFGFGWALSGACPGPMFVNIGYGFGGFILIMFFGTVGTYTYGVVKDKLPH
jgi:uncharacterized membrane protein YedE/YeeE